MNTQARIIPMSDRVYEMVPLDKIVVLNSRSRDAQQFEAVVRSIAAVGMLQPIRVNRRNLEKSGCYGLIYGEGRFLACKQLGHSAIYAQVVDYDDEAAYIESLVENMARIPQGTMAYAREVKRMRDEGKTLDRIASIAGKHPTYISGLIQLVEQGEDRLIIGVEQGLFSMSFAIEVAQSKDGQAQNLMIDAFDSGLVNCANMTNVRKIIELRLTHGKNRDKRSTPASPMPAYTVSDLTKDITRITKEKEGFVRETTTKENRLFTMLLALKTLAEDDQWRTLVSQAGIAEPPQLEGNYNITARQ